MHLLPLKGIYLQTTWGVQAPQLPQFVKEWYAGESLIFVIKTFGEEIRQVSRGVLSINLNLGRSWVKNQN